MKPILTCLLIATLGLPAMATAQGLRYARQTIFGMDCAPCAYGVEKGLKALPGVRTVKVSLNEGYAEVTLGDAAATSLADIRKTIRNSGFTPKQAQVRIEGTLQRSPQPQLQAGNIVYPLHFDVLPSRDLPDDNSVVVSGTAATDTSVVRVQTID